MKLVFSILAVALFFASCSTAYRSGQTPDDVYFSPDRPQTEEYVRVDEPNDRQYRNNNNQYNNNNRYDDRNGYDDDRYLRMRVRNPRMWSDLDYYYNDPFAYNYYSPFRGGNYIGIYSVHPYAYSYYNPYSFWNSNFNPYYSPYAGYYGNLYGKVIVGNPRPQVYNRPRTSNLNIFNNSANTQYNSSRNGNKPRTFRLTNENNSRRNSGDNLRDVFGNSDRNNNRTYDNNTYNSSQMNNSSNSNNNSSNNSNRSSGGSAPARRF